jgi:hypothetical protein
MLNRAMLDFFLQVNMIPLKESANVSVAASGTGTAIISVPDLWFIKSITITKGADVTVTSVLVDSNDTNTIASISDTIPKYGALLTSRSKIEISGSNAGLGAQSLEITVEGFKVKQQ